MRVICIVIEAVHQATDTLVGSKWHASSPTDKNIPAQTVEENVFRFNLSRVCSILMNARLRATARHESPTSPNEPLDRMRSTEATTSVADDDTHF